MGGRTRRMSSDEIAQTIIIALLRLEEAFIDGGGRAAAANRFRPRSGENKKNVEAAILQ